jgi:hypothetical protein
MYATWLFRFCQLCFHVDYLIWEHLIWGDTFFFSEHWTRISQITELESLRSGERTCNDRACHTLSKHNVDGSGTAKRACQTSIIDAPVFLDCKCVSPCTNCLLQLWTLLSQNWQEQQKFPNMITRQYKIFFLSPRVTSPYIPGTMLRIGPGWNPSCTLPPLVWRNQYDNPPYQLSIFSTIPASPANGSIWLSKQHSNFKHARFLKDLLDSKSATHPSFLQHYKQNIPGHLTRISQLSLISSN